MSRPVCDTCHDSGKVREIFDSGITIQAAHRWDPNAVNCPDCVVCTWHETRHDVKDECAECIHDAELDRARDELIERLAVIVSTALRNMPKVEKARAA